MLEMSYEYRILFAYTEGGERREITHKTKGAIKYTPETLKADIEFRLKGFPPEANAEVVEVYETVKTTARIIDHATTASRALPCPITRIVEELRDFHRIKYNTDYSIIHKYNQNHLTCHKVYEDTIRTVAETNGVYFSTVHTYEG